MRLHSPIACVAALISTFASAADPTAFVCSFNSGYLSSNTGSGGSFSTAPTPDKMQLTYAAIDVEKGSAQMIGNQGAANVTVLRGMNSVHFLEVTPVGGITLTTVFNTPGPGGAFLAVHSRHIGGTPVPPIVSQFVGSCEGRWP